MSVNGIFEKKIQVNSESSPNKSKTMPEGIHEETFEETLGGAF